MPISFFVAIFFAIIALVAFVIWRGTKRLADAKDAAVADAQTDYDNADPGSEARRMAQRRYETARDDRNNFETFPAGIGIGLLVVALLFGLLASVAAVPARNIGVVTSFGKPVDDMESGLNFKAPWEKVTRLDGTIQTNSAIGAEGDGPDSDDYDIGDVTVRLGNESLATVRYTVRWRIKLDSAQALYQEYRGMSKIRESLVTRETFDALNKVLGNYDPLAEIKGDTDAGTADFGAYAEQIKDLIQNSTDGAKIEIVSVSLPLVKYDKSTQKKLDLYQTQVASTRVAEELEKTNIAQARANKALSDSISNDPNILVKQCFDSLDTLVDKGGKVPAGFTCWPGSNIDGLIVK